MTVSTETWLAMVEQARAAGCQIVRRPEGVFLRVGATAGLVQVDTLKQLEDLIAADRGSPLHV